MRNIRGTVNVIEMSESILDKGVLTGAYVISEQGRKRANRTLTYLARIRADRVSSKPST